VPEVTASGVRVRVLSGSLAHATGPLVLATPALLWHVRVPPHARFTAPVPADYELAMYHLVGPRCGRIELLGTGDAVALDAGEPGTDVLLVGGRAADRPLVFHGPFVACSAGEAQAYDAAYASGAMGWVDEESF
jgi:redox-sensitive bicupin YhaK (pirin superfamily)